MSDSEVRQALQAAFDDEEVNETQPENNTPINESESDLGPAEPAESHPNEEPGQESKDRKAAEDKPSKAEVDDVPRETKAKKKPSPPVDWSGDAKKAFAELPEHVQRAVHDREVHINKALQDTAEARRFADGVVRTLEPYQQLFQAEGVNDPLAAVNGLLQTTAMLKFGSKQQKAQRLAQIVQHYDIDIETLDKALAGSLPQNTEEDRLQRMLEERLQPVNQFMGQLNQWQQQQAMQLQNEAAQSVQQMRENVDQFPHIEEVRFEMANLLDEAAARGITNVPLEAVYEEACRRTPGIREEIYKKEFGGMMQQNMERKRNAASSVSGRSEGNSGSTNLEDMSLRDAIAAQFAGSDRI